MKQVKTFSEYMSDETRVSFAERERINSEIELIGKTAEVQELKANPRIVPLESKD